MADDLSFTISAQDQASRAVETVQKKIQSFGGDVAKLALGVVGPMALLQAGIGYVTEKWQEYKQAQQEAFDKGASGTYEEVKAQESLGLQLDKNLSILLAMAKVKAENAKNAEDVKAQEDQAIEEFKNSQAGYRFIQKMLQQRGITNNLYSRDEILAAAKEEGARINAELAKQREEERNAENGYDNVPTMTEHELKLFREMLEIRKELDKRGGKSLSEINAIDTFSRNFKDEMANAPKQKTKEQTKQDLVLTVSSLREIGGSFGGGDISSGVETQIALAQKQVDTLIEIRDAMNKGSLESQVFPEPLREAMATTA
jgi:hypothetical protein